MRRYLMGWQGGIEERIVHKGTGGRIDVKDDINDEVADA